MREGTTKHTECCKIECKSRISVVRVQQESRSRKGGASVTKRLTRCKFTQRVSKRMQRRPDDRDEEIEQEGRREGNTRGADLDDVHGPTRSHHSSVTSALGVASAGNWGR
jgi:hypothetical protein